MQFNRSKDLGMRKTTKVLSHDQSSLSSTAPHFTESEIAHSPQTDGSQSKKIKFLCSFGGKILSRPSDGKLRYVGGDTRMISISKNISFDELVKKTSESCNQPHTIKYQPHTIKYQLPDEDIDAFISVSSDEDLQNMIEEYYNIEKRGGSQRLRIFLVPLIESENSFSINPSSIPHITEGDPDYQYFVAVNGGSGVESNVQPLEPEVSRNNVQIPQVPIDFPKLRDDTNQKRESKESVPPVPEPNEMTDGFEGIFASCWKYFVHKDEDDNTHHRSGHVDPLQWSRDLEKYHCGDFSFAVEQANTVLQDFSQVESFPSGTFFSVYDGHIGPEAARYVCDHLFNNLLKRMAAENGTVYESTIKNAFADTEESFLTHVRQACADEPIISAVGSCCLVGVIQNGTLYIANLGDSRAVLGYVTSRSPNKILARLLTKDHNAHSEEVRKELWKLHPKDRNIVLKRHGAWRVKGIIQVTRAIGDAYLKRPEFALDESFPEFHLTEKLTEPALRADPDLLKMDLDQNHKFVIFASDGLWEWLSIKRAVKIVQRSPREGIARKLIDVALGKVMEHHKMSFNEVKAHEAGSRRVLHDDITVIVVFLDNLVPNNSVTTLSVRGFSDGSVGPTDGFNSPDGVDEDDLRSR